MKDVICFIDKNEKYVKKLNNYAIKKFGKEYLFLWFSNIKSLIEYAEENKVKSIILSNEFEKDIKFLSSTFYYVQTEKKDISKKDGNIKYIYKYQNVDELLNEIDKDIKNHDKKNIKMKSNTKIIAYYSPYQTKEKEEKLYKIYKAISKKKKVLVVELDEYCNYMGRTGLSNIIYKYKENLLSVDSIKDEIEEVDGVLKIESVSYPEDYAVINNVDMSNIISEIKNLDYEYVFVNCDVGFLRNQYIFIDCDKILLFDGSKTDTKKTDIFIKYIEQQNMLNMNKIYRFTKDSIEKKSLQTIIDELFGEK